MKLITYKIKNTPVLKLEEDITTKEINNFSNLVKTLTLKHEIIVFDISKQEHLNTSIINTFSKIKDYSKIIIYIENNKTAYNILDSIGFTKIFKIVKDYSVLEKFCS